MKISLLLLMILVFAGGAFGQINRIPVYITVSGGADAATTLKSSLAKKLRLIKDVEVVSGAADFSVELVVGETVLKSGELTGYTVVANFIRIAKCGDKVYLDLQDSLVYTADPKGLEALSGTIADKFNDEVLTDYRKKSRN